MVSVTKLQLSNRMREVLRLLGEGHGVIQPHRGRGWAYLYNPGEILRFRMMRVSARTIEALVTRGLLAEKPEKKDFTRWRLNKDGIEAARTLKAAKERKT